MHIGEIHQLREAMQIPESGLLETHISWVLLAENLVYKIKKPVRFSFLDFSTLEKRRTYCEKEVVLNRRLTEGMYLGVSTIRRGLHGLTIDGEGEVADYAVVMRRMPGERRMDILLDKNAVTETHLEQIADRLAGFHRNGRIPPEPPDPDILLADFADLENSFEAGAAFFEEEKKSVIKKSIDTAGRFLHKYGTRIRQRYNEGFVIDGHGDLHSRNIFLLDKPVIFDCIEFNDHFRYVDVLDELAFFCLDLEFFGRNDLATHFLKYYLHLYPCMPAEDDRKLFHYFQLYRSGVKLKVNLIKASGSPDTITERLRRNLSGYMRLFEHYLEQPALS